MLVGVCSCAGYTSLHTLLIIVLAATLSLSAQTTTITKATVSGVIDGDTVIATIDGKSEHVRLTCIDAPETTQDYGTLSTEALKKQVEGKTLYVYLRGRDKYGRHLGELYMGTQSINLWMVESGNAWVYTEYCNNDLYKQYQSDAQSARIGLWASGNPVEPWHFRHGTTGGTTSTSVESSKSAKTEGIGETATTSPEKVDVPPVPRGQAHIETMPAGQEIWRSSGSANGSVVHTGPRGGKYRISPSGRKVYIPKSRR